ncbi:hypothetical protein DICSQDRAFT_123258 [Dichomitus squalens LYAD-421 SS1]|uniref:Transmembrane protein n=1 Tax=Dichomitus squalens TaxID=114155 RepID=A0A4Q9QBE9_9APHY|nr:uncharacterized protein DICSQDRAFT_123258 [Dichomitus squalens LYAD-421 SS1]EJF66646.1 hypothetical protein DICSQDRAFT_123258 [Dichomitus squalens LYAD-421 SS1]TBU65013.1 hypothetical protein BD310DRAFT_913857 [Dichomitus squalens]
MYIREYEGYAESGHDLLSNSNLYPSCQPPAAHCSDVNHQPARAQSVTALSSPPHPTPTLAGGRPATQEAFSDDITRFGRRNFIGFVVLGVLVFVGLVLWMTFGMWPRRALSRLRERLARKRGRRERGGSTDKEGGNGSVTRAQELERDRCSESAAECSEKAPDQDDGSIVEVRRQASAHSAKSAGSVYSLSSGAETLEEGEAEAIGRAETVPRVHFA